MKIALVDDDPRALAQLEQYLTEQLGRETEISHYGSGEALLADWRPGAFELVVLDIYMGGATGMEVARRLRAGDGQVRLAFATSSNDFASESYEVGACYYLRKPFRPEGVRAMLERLDLEALERSRRLRLPDGRLLVWVCVEREQAEITLPPGARAVNLKGEPLPAENNRLTLKRAPYALSRDNLPPHFPNGYYNADNGQPEAAYLTGVTMEELQKRNAPASVSYTHLTLPTTPYV